MFKSRAKGLAALAATAVLAAGLAGCRAHMPHAWTWPAGGDVGYTHAKPAFGGDYKNWDPWAATIEVTPVEATNPVRTQHILIATVLDKDGKPLPNRRVEWTVAAGSVGDIVEVDESGWRASRGYKVTSHYAVSHTNSYDHVLTMGTEDTSDDVHLKKGQTWCVISSPVEGDTHVMVYAPGIYDWNQHKKFVVKHWYDVKWNFPPPASNPVMTPHKFATQVLKASDGTPLAGYSVTYRIVDGPDATFGNGAKVETVKTNDAGVGEVTLKQTKAAEGTNNIAIEIWRPANEQCCKPAVKIAEGRTAKTWLGPKLACNKTVTPGSVLAGDTFDYTITVTNPSQVEATNVVVTDKGADGIQFVSSEPAGSGSWNVGNIPPGGSKTVKIKAKATKTGTFENCAEVRSDQGATSKCCTKVTASSPKLQIEKRCTEKVTVCDPIEYVITIKNTGDGPARNVQLKDTIPDGLEATSGKDISRNIGELPPGQTREIRYSLKATKPGRFTNTASVTADGGLKADASCTTVVSKPVLEVTKTGPDTRFIGRNAEYTITVKNASDTEAKDTVLRDPIPANASFVSATDGGVNENGVAVWRLGTLEPGASKSVKITLKATGMGKIDNKATATAYCAEASASVSTNVQGIAAILLEVEDIADPIEVGANETYEIVVTNQGSANDTNIVIECTLPPEQKYVSSEGPTQATVSGQVVKFAPLPSLAPKAKATWKVVVQGLKEGDVRFKVKLTSDVLQTSVDETESTHIY